MKIAVLTGGVSEERSVSLASGSQVASALRKAGHEVVAVDTARGVLSAAEELELLESGVQGAPAPDATDLLVSGDATALTRSAEVTKADVLFLALHGGSGEDGTLQTLLDLVGLPYTGSGPVGCALAMDKDLSKRLLRDGGVATPDWIMGPTPAHDVVARLGLPVIVKPVSGGSTVGLTLVRDPAEMEEATERATAYGAQVMYEEYVRGREVTVGILGDRALPVGEIIPAHEIFDYECKYLPGMAQEIFPADLEPSEAAALQKAALLAHGLLRLRDYSRVDFMVDPEGGIWCLEANALPGMTANSLMPRAAAAIGMPFARLCERIAELAIERRAV